MRVARAYTTTKMSLMTQGGFAKRGIVACMMVVTMNVKVYP